MLLWLLTSCATQPAPSDPRIANAAAVQLPGTTPRVGIEYLPPEPGDGDAQPARVDGQRGGDRDAGLAKGPPATPLSRRDERQHTWTMDTDDLVALDEPLARYTLGFVQELIGEDKRRTRRELQEPLLLPRQADMQSPGLLLGMEQQQIATETEYIAEHGSVILQAPVRRWLRHTPLVRSLELVLDDFQADHVPLTQPYQASHTEERHLGRIAMRIRTNQLKDPVEIAYIKSGVRIGSSRNTLKLGLSRELTDALTLEVNSSHDYDGGAWNCRADLIFYLSNKTSLHLVGGTDLDFLGTSALYSQVDSPMNGSTGYLLYAVHVF